MICVEVGLLQEKKNGGVAAEFHRVTSLPGQEKVAVGDPMTKKKTTWG